MKSAKYLANELGVDRETIYRWIKRGVIPEPQKHGRFLRWSDDVVSAILTEINTHKDLVNKKDLATRLGCSITKVNGMIKRGQLPHPRISHLHSSIQGWSPWEADKFVKKYGKNKDLK